MLTGFAKALGTRRVPVACRPGTNSAKIFVETATSGTARCARRTPTATAFQMASSSDPSPRFAGDRGSTPTPTPTPTPDLPGIGGPPPPPLAPPICRGSGVHPSGRSTLARTTINRTIGPLIGPVELRARVCRVGISRPERYTVECYFGVPTTASCLRPSSSSPPSVSARCPSVGSHAQGGCENCSKCACDPRAKRGFINSNRIPNGSGGRARSGKSAPGSCGSKRTQNGTLEGLLASSGCSPGRGKMVMSRGQGRCAVACAPRSRRLGWAAISVSQWRPLRFRALARRGDWRAAAAA